MITIYLISKISPMFFSVAILLINSKLKNDAFLVVNINLNKVHQDLRLNLNNRSEMIICE
jgi:hypothetical protein